MDRALEAGVDEVNFVVVATDTFSMRNQGSTTAESIETWERLMSLGYGNGTRFGVTMGAAFGCPFEGEVPVDRVVEVAARVADAGAQEIALADTIGVASPGDVTRRFGAVREAVGPTPLRCHFHNTRNTGSPTPSRPLWRGCAASTPRSEAWEAARSLPTPPATSPPRTSSTCCSGWAGPQKFPCPPSSAPRSGWRAGSGSGSRGC